MDSLHATLPTTSQCYWCGLTIAHNDHWVREGAVLLHQECELAWTRRECQRLYRELDVATKKLAQAQASLIERRNSRSGPARYWRERCEVAEAAMRAMMRNE